MSNSTIKFLIVLVVIGYIIQFLKDVGISTILFMVLVGGIIYYFYKRKPTPSENKSVTVQIEADTENESIHINQNEEYPYNTPIELIQAFEEARFDQLRFLLQKIAYEMVGNRRTQKEKDEFKKIMTYFASRDPLYARVIRKFIAIIAKQEGFIQSKIYPLVPEYDTETLRYVLYFGHELEDIYRVKKGRSYELYSSIDAYNLANGITKTIISNNLNIEVSIVSDEEYYNKIKESTKLKDQGKIDEACDLLLSIRDKMELNTKLALYLQQAGRFEESIMELKRLVDIAPKCTKRIMKNKSKTDQNKLLFAEYTKIYDKARLIHQREKLKNETLYFNILSTLTDYYRTYFKEDMDNEVLEELEEIITEQIDKAMKKIKDTQIKDEILLTIHSVKLTNQSMPQLNTQIAKILKVRKWKISEIK